jgi:hypothetical protein
MENPGSYIDLEADANMPSLAALSTLSSLVEELIAAQAKIKAVETQLGLLKAEERQLLEDRLPAAADAAGVSKFETTTGDVLKIKNIVSVSLPSYSSITKAKDQEKVDLLERRKAVLDWLVEHKHEDLIKTEVSVEFGRGERSQAVSLHKQIVMSGKEATLEETIHPQTFNSWAREKLEKGEDIPAELFKLHTARVADIKLSKNRS